MQEEKQSNYLSPGGFFFCILFGVLIPLGTLGLEIYTSMCADVFFDPIPTPWHIAAVAFVPLSNLFVGLVLRSKKEKYARVSGIVNGITVGISFFYVLVFLPLFPLSLIAIILYGMGILPLAPLFAFTVALVLGIKLGKWFSLSKKIRGAGFALGILLLSIAEVPMALTQIGLQMAVSPSPEKRIEGIQLLRDFGNDELMLRSCYIQSRGMTDGMGFFSYLYGSIGVNDARNVYYRVTGTPFYSAPVPGYYKNRFGNEFEWDEGTGGKEVLARQKSLSLIASRLDGSMDGDAALGYLEWTMVFKNDHPWTQHEARARIAAPPGAVISRLTLWIDGEEKEAVFAAKAKVRKAYENVVRKKRDPVLVTLQGETWLMQCFPVPPKGGEMKVRLGITLPMEIEDLKHARLRLPFLVERNFSFSPQASHSVWISSKNPILLPKNRGTVQTEEELYEWKEMISEENWKDISGEIRLERSPDVFQAWTQDGNGFILQTLREAVPFVPKTVVFVVDASRSMAPYMDEIARAMTAPEKMVPSRFVVASDRVLEHGYLINKAGQNRLLSPDFRGGCDNLAALARAWDIAEKIPESALVWIHGPQPVLLDSPETLRQRMERSANTPMLYTFAVTPGPNRIREELDTGHFVSLPRSGSVSQDIQKLLDRWAGKEKRWTWERERLASNTGFQKNAKQTSLHLAKLWAYDQVMNLFVEEGRSHGKRVGNRQEALDLVARYGIVSPISGAVVLETKEQYDEAGLSDSPSHNIPTIPEPEMWLLLLVIGAVLSCAFCRTKILSSAS